MACESGLLDRDCNTGGDEMRRKLLWRARKQSEADPFRFLPCGCKVWVYDNTIVRLCEAHEQDRANNNRESGHGRKQNISYSPDTMP